MPVVYDSDVRYGVGLLDVSNSAQAARGEIMADNQTAEIYLKRPSDGKVISFRQKSQSAYEALQEFNLQFESSYNFIYPSDPGTFLLGTKVDVDEFAVDAKKRDILKENISFNQDTATTFQFDLATGTNGFFIKPMTRQGDRNACAYLAGTFSLDEYTDFGAVNPTFTDWLDLSPLYDNTYDYTTWKTYERWKSSAALIDYQVKVTGMTKANTTTTNTLQVTQPVRLNEYNCVQFPDDYNRELVSISAINVTVKKIYFPKLQYERELLADKDRPSGVTPVLEGFMESDYRAVLNCCDCFWFISDAGQIPSFPCFDITNLFDADFVKQSMQDMDVASSAWAVQIQVEEPEKWPKDTLWAEPLRQSAPGGMVPTESENTFEDLEKKLYHDEDPYLYFTTDRWDLENIWVRDMGDATTVLPED